MAERVHITGADVARLLGIGEASVVEMVRAGALPGTETDGAVLVKTSALRRWLRIKNERALRSVAGPGDR